MQRFISTTFLLTLLAHLTQAEDYIQCFNNLRSNFTWPLGPGTETQCLATTTFGPMLSQCVKPGEHTFTRSMGLLGKIGDSVYASLSGRVVHVGDFFPGNPQLRTIIIKHDFDTSCTHGDQTVDSFFSIYGNLLTGDNEPQFTIGEYVNGGDIIGHMGKCDKCKKDLGDKTSVLYQIRLDIDNCPDLGGKCGRYGSPVHPLLTRPPIDNVPPMRVVDMTEGDGLGAIYEITTSCSQTDFYRMSLSCETGSFYDDDKNRVDFVLDLNTREGFDALPNLYNRDKYGRPNLAPVLYPFSRKKETWTTGFWFPDGFFGYDTHYVRCDVTFEGLFGDKVTTSFRGAIE